MMIAPLTTSTADATRSSRLEALSRTARTATSEASADEKKMRGVVGEFAGMAFYQTLLSQARNTSLRSDLFHGGRGEEVFGSRFDALLAERLAEADQPGLVDAIYQSMTRDQAPRTERQTQRSDQ